MEWLIEDEENAKKEYFLMIDTLKNEPEFENEWGGHWEDEMKENFMGRVTKIKGDKDKYMKYYLKNKNAVEFDNFENLDENI